MHQIWFETLGSLVCHKIAEGSLQIIVLFILDHLISLLIVFADATFQAQTEPTAAVLLWCVSTSCP